MNFQSNSHITFYNQNNAEIASINTTPLVDVMLVLLIIFMITIPLFSLKAPINLPQEKAQKFTNQQSLQIFINNNKQVSFNNSAFSELTINDHNKISSLITKYNLANPNSRFEITADKDLGFAEISKILSILKLNNINQVGFAVNPKSNNDQ